MFFSLCPLWGPLPCFLSLQLTIMQSRATGITDHILPLGDWLSIYLAHSTQWLTGLIWNLWLTIKWSFCPTRNTTGLSCIWPCRLLVYLAHFTQWLSYLTWNLTWAQESRSASFQDFLSSEIQWADKSINAGIWFWLQLKGVFLLKTTNAIATIKCVFSANTYSQISIIPQGSEQNEWASSWMEQVSELSEAK